MKNIVIQLQNLSQINNPFQQVKELATQVDSKVTVIQGEIDEAENFCTIHLTPSQESKEFWNKFKNQFLDKEEFANNSIVVLQKDINWNDYYLLHTFTGEEIDLLE